MNTQAQLIPPPICIPIQAFIPQPIPKKTPEQERREKLTALYYYEKEKGTLYDFCLEPPTLEQYIAKYM